MVASLDATPQLITQHDVILALSSTKGGVPESHTFGSNASLLQKPRFWILGCAENDASLKFLPFIRCSHR
jgi:hypothetical protein